MHQTWRAVGFLFLLIVLAPSAHADGASMLPRVYAEPGAVKDRQLSGSTAVPDHVDPFSGALSLSHVDLVLPGNGGLDIKIQRYYSSNIWFNRSNPLSVFNEPSVLLPPKPTGAGWTIGFGRVILAANRGTNVCEKWGNVIGGIGTVSTQWNAVLETPDGSMQPLTVSASGIADFITKKTWVANCYGNNEGLTVHSPDGLKYTMNHKVYAPDEMNYTGSPVNVWYPTTIEDGKGNSLQISYTGGRTGSYAHINGITSNDGRVVQFTYSGGVLTQISSGNRAWNYEYVAASSLLGTGRKLLTKVIRPDGSEWLYGYNGIGMSAPGALNSVTAPYGGSVAYTYGLVDFDGSIAALAGQDKFASVAVKTRIVKGYGGVALGLEAGTWTYTYQPGTDTTLETGRMNDVTIIDTPVGTETYRHYGMQRFATETGFSADRMWSIGLLGSKTITGGGATQTEYYNWGVPTDSNGVVWVISDEIDNPVGYGLQQRGVINPQLLSKTIIRDGATYSTTYSYVLTDPRPQSMTETGQDTRTTQLNWFPASPQAVWLYNQILHEIIPQYDQYSNYRNFNWTNGKLESVWLRGFYEEYTHTPQGDVATKKNGRGHTWEYQNYLRGLPQLERRPDSTSIERVVNTNGLVDSETNGRNNRTSYNYDDMNRLAGINRPQGASATIVWSAGAVPGSNFKRTVTRGSYKETTQYDGFGLVTCVDTTNGTNHVTQLFRYNALGHKVYESYPFDGSCSASVSLAGDSYTTDALGRVTKVTHADQTFRTYSFAAGNQVTMTDERGKVTTYVYRSYGDPDKERHLMRVDAPENVRTVFERNPIGQITSVTQGSYDVSSPPGTVIASETRTYDYDLGQNFLVRETNPETGTTTYGRDGVGNMTSKNVGGATTSYGYDPLNRLKAVNYPLGTPDLSLDYDANGNLRRLYSSTGRNVSDGTQHILSTERLNTYDANDNLTRESLTYSDAGTSATGVPTVFESKLLETRYDYNALDALTSITYPSTRVVNFSPDALGRPTRVGPFVNSVGYHPTGQPSSISYANGQQTSIDLKTGALRPWIDRIRTGSLSHLSYDYDAAGNVTRIADGINPTYTQSMDYDGLNRLTTANGNWGSGRIAYDGVGNIRSKNLGTQNLGYNYDGGNRLTSITGARNYSFSYDRYGNAITNGANLFTYDDASNLITVSGGPVINYWYDGKNMRVREQKGATTKYFFYASNGSLLGEYDRNGTQYKEYAYLGSKLVAMREVGIQPPTANAGTDQTVSENSSITLDGSASSDLDGVISSYSWTQTAGPTATLAGANTVQPTLIAPYVTADSILTFQLTITDNDGATSNDTVNINVVKVSLPSVVISLSAQSGNGQNTLQWQPATAPSNAGAITYNLYWSTTAGVTKATGTRISNVTSPYAHTGLANGTRYYYIVAAQNNAGESPASSEVSAQTGVSSWSSPYLLEYNDLGSVAFSPGNPYSYIPPVFVDSNGNTRVVWTQTDGISPRIWTRSYNAVGGWSVPQILPDINISSFSSYVWGMKIKLLDADGNMVAAWISPRGLVTDVIASRYSPVSGWAPPVTVATSSLTIAGLEIASNTTGNTVVSWGEDSAFGTTHLIKASYYSTSSSTWTTSILASEPSSNLSTTHASMDVSGNAMVIWRTQGGVQTASNYLSSTGTWSHYRIGTSLSAIAFRSTPEGKAIVALATGSAVHAHAYDPASGWSSAQLADAVSAPSNQSVISASLSSSGHAVVSWVRTPPVQGPTTIHAAYRNPITGWDSAPTTIAQLPIAAYTYAINTDVSSNGNAAVGWVPFQQNLLGISLSSYWVAHRDVAQGWRGPIRITGASAENYANGGLLPIVNPQLRLDAGGNAQLFWMQAQNNNSGFYDLMGAQFAALGSAFPHQNASPFADAGGTQNVREGTLITLDGTRSFDPDGTIVSYSWTQATIPGSVAVGPAVTLSNANTATPSFTPNFEGHPTYSQGYVFGFILTVTDDRGASSSSAVAIQVTDLPSPKVVQATPGNAQNTIIWNSTSAVSYNIYWSTSPGITKTNSNVITAVTRPYVHSGLNNITTYYYAVSAVYYGDYESPLSSSEVSATPTPSPVPNTWETPVSVGPASNKQFSIASDPNGNATAIWWGLDPANTTTNVNVVYASRYTVGAGWSSPVIIGLDPASIGTQGLSVAMDSLGNAMAAWLGFATGADNISRAAVFTRRYDLLTGWGTTNVISLLTSNAGTVSLAMDAGGNAIAVWPQSASIGGGTLHASRYVPATGWTTPVTIGSVGSVWSASLAMDINGNALVAWAQGSDITSVYSNRYSLATGWQTPQLVHGNGTAPNVAINVNGDGVISWHTASLPFDLYTRRSAANGMQAPAQLVQSNIGYQTGSPPRVVLENNGNATLLWLSNLAGRNFRPYISQSASSGTWSASTLLQSIDTTAYLSHLGVDVAGNVTVIWFQFDGEMSMYANRFQPATGWSGNQVINTAANPDGGAAVTVADNGDVMAIYLGRSSTGSGGSMWSSRFNARKTNSPPAVTAGVDQTVASSNLVLLNGKATDADGTIASYAWTQTAGPSVTLFDVDGASARFTAPPATPGTVLTFQLTATDNDSGIGTATINVTVSGTPNSPPGANPGVAQTVNEGAVVTLNGSGFDIDGSIASYAWTQTAGPAVTLATPAAAITTFTAPPVTADTVLTFRLTVTDNRGATGSAPVNVTVRNLNNPPVANAGLPQTVNKGSTVTLTGSGTDSDGTIASYAWTQTAGPAVTLATPTAASTTFTAPQVTADTLLTFQLTVTDNNGASASASTSVTVQNVNLPPVVNAGANQSVNEATLVTLNGSATDSDGTVASYQWTQTAGPTVTLNNATAATASFLAPTVTSNTVFSFRLTAIDNQGASANATTNITVNNVSVSGRDVIVSALSASTSRVNPGQTLTVTNTVMNQGTTSITASFSVRIYLSTDTTITTADTVLATRSIASLSAGALNTAATTVTFPSTLTTGTYYVGAIADYTNTASESNESNNAKLGPILTVNAAPTANAGANQTVDEGATVTLTGSGTDSDGTIASYAWTQTAGPTVTLTNANTATASFVTPGITANTIFTFRLTVTDNDGRTGTATTNVTVNNINQSPTANAGSARSVNRGSVVTLAGSGADPDGTIASYAWTQTAGPAVTLTNGNTATASFTAPIVSTDTLLTFRLTVTDNGGATGSATVNITVLSANVAPTANAGTNQSVNEGTAVVLTGSATDVDGNIASYQWTQTAGPTVTLNNATTATAGFTAPQVTVDTPLTFQITATDNNGATGTASITVTVRNVIPSPQVASVTTSTFGTNTITHAVTMPAAVSAGDLLLMLVASDASSNQTTPSGWTALFLNQRSGTAVTFSAYTKVATGTEGGTTVNVATSATEQAAAQVYRITDWYGTLSGVVSSTSATGTNANPDPASLTPSWGAANTLWLATHAYDYSATRNTTAYPANYTNGLQTRSNTGTSAVHVATAQRTLNTTTENPGTFSVDAADDWVARTIAIRPAP